jgi:thiamine-phosphate pyrophosphorylase
MSRTISGLYAVTPETGDCHWLAERAAQALSGGARILQYRAKRVDPATRVRTATELARLCRERRALFIVNDDIDLAARVGAHGVHLGGDDASVAEARARLGAGAVIGASCYDDLQRADAQAAAGASYLAFGSFFPSTVKPGAVRAPLALLRRARARFDLPLVAIGGITVHNAGELIASGADAVAVITALFEAADTAAAAAAFAGLFESGPVAHGEHLTQ